MTTDVATPTMATESVTIPIPRKRRLRFQFNPVLRRELRSRMRGGRAFLVLGVFLVAMALLIVAFDQAVHQPDVSRELESFQVGQILFAGLTLLQMLLLVLVVPALTATTISTEREHETFDLMRATPVRAWTIVWGKLLSAVSYAALLIIAGLPMMAVVFLYGGINLEDVLIVYLLLGLSILLFGTIGLFCSTLSKSVSTSTALAYTLVALVAVVPVLAYVAVDARDGGLIDSGMGEQVMGNGQFVVVDQAGIPRPVEDSEDDTAMRIFLSANPVLAVAELVAKAVDEDPDDVMFGQPTSGLPVIDDMLEVLQLDDGPRFIINQNGQPVPVEDDSRPIWHYSIVIFPILTVVFLALAVLFVAHPPRRPRIWRRRAPRPVP